MFVDSHCHLEDEATAVRAGEVGVRVLLNAGKDLDEMAGQLLMCRKMAQWRKEGKTVPLMFTSAGVHPENAAQKLSLVQTDDIIRALDDPLVVAVGECGLDYHYGADSVLEQKEMFWRHIEAAGKTGLPLMIHVREAEDDLLTLLDDGIKTFGRIFGVIHCFSSDMAFAKKVEALGFYVSASGILTFKNAEDIREVFKSYALEKILIETDSPYLAPVPFRGKVNEPAYVIKTAEKLSELRGLSLNDTAEQTKKNFFKLYQKAADYLKTEGKDLG